MAEQDISPCHVLLTIRNIEEVHDVPYEDYADNFFHELERSTEESEYFIRTGNQIYIKSLWPIFEPPVQRKQ